jgi:hypothetical protein
MFQHFCKQGLPSSASSICPSCSSSSIVFGHVDIAQWVLLRLQVAGPSSSYNGT